MRGLCVRAVAVLLGFLAASVAVSRGHAQAPTCAQSVHSPQAGELTQATYYHRSLAGDLMANGQRYEPSNPRLAASNRYRLGTRLQVTRVDGRARISVEVVDRGSAELDLDLSEAAFERLAPLWQGRLLVCVEVIG